ncbi:alpha/beta fold hydrolase [Halovenus sp. WSH3]|uniref:Alpha/beta fold hydrolase n=1 Tax=Halovenus carboxidivorans TaxID=2692199 RepID=A0A6B0TIW3_9EURY|nr:alpha/beta hydrolase [Halovenus carboxidivorans]MXR53149.1 alpha/beta fold hydrolase [Halovenus carboxidivorans]
MLGLIQAFEAAGAVAEETYSEFGLFQPDKPSSRLERLYTDDSSAFVEVGDSRIHYRESGDPSDPTMVLLHGTYSSLHTWDGWAGELSDSYHLVRLDMPGFGLTGPRRRGELSLEYLIETVGEFCDDRGLSAVTLVGNSLGGGIAWRLSLDRPDLVSRLILIDAGGATLLARLAGNLMSLGTDFVPRYATPRLLIRLVIRDAYGNESKVTPELVRRYHDLLLRPGNRRSVLEIARNYAADHPGGKADDAYGYRFPSLPSSYSPSPRILDDYDIEAVSVPTLFQWGSEDEWLPVSFGKGLAARVPDSHFITYDGVGHVPMEETPVPTARDADRFVRERP